MFFKQKKGPALDPQQHELLERAQQRIRQKKDLFQHLVVFLIGSVFAIVLNKILKYGEPHNWYQWIIAIWAFIFILHFSHVFVTNPLLGKQWERSQREKLLRKQQERIRKLEEEIARTHPLPEPPKKKEG
jgi:hypothetical protein